MQIVIDQIKEGRQIEIHLLNVQLPIISGNVRMFVSKELIDNYYQERGIEALRSVRTMIDDARVPCTSHIGVAHIAETITNFTKKLHCEQIVMGTRGRGSVSGLQLGSVAVKILHLADVPVMLVK